MLIKVYKDAKDNQTNLFEVEANSYSEIKTEILDRVKVIAQRLSGINEAYSIQTSTKKLAPSETIEIITVQIEKITSKKSSKRLSKAFNKGIEGIDDYESENICKYTFYAEKEYSEELKVEELKVEEHEAEEPKDKERKKKASIKKY